MRDHEGFWFVKNGGIVKYEGASTVELLYRMATNSHYMKADGIGRITQKFNPATLNGIEGVGFLEEHTAGSRLSQKHNEQQGELHPSSPAVRDWNLSGDQNGLWICTDYKSDQPYETVRHEVRELSGEFEYFGDITAIDTQTHDLETNTVHVRMRTDKRCAKVKAMTSIMEEDGRRVFVSRLTPIEIY